MHVPLLSFALLLGAAAPAGGVAQALDRYIESSVPAGFSGQVLLADHGVVVLRKSYGFADRAHRIPFTNETRTGIASASKQFTAAAILKLQDQGKLAVTDPLSKFFPDVPADKAKITLLQVITHTSGLAGGFADDFTGSDDMSIVRELFAKPLTAPPGTRFRYSSEAYALLGTVIARASGTTYHDYLRRELFDPAGMTHSGFWSDRGTPAAHAYVGWVDNGDASTWPRSWRVNGSGDVLTTASDLYAWDQALHAGKILSPPALQAYFTPLVDCGPFRPNAKYGYGLFFEQTDRGTPEIEHGGDTERGYNAAFSRFPSEGLVEIILANAYTARGSSLRAAVQPAVEAAYVDGKTPSFRSGTLVPAPALDRLTGTYDLPGGTLALRSDGVYLWATLGGQKTIDASLGYGADAKSLADADAQTARLMDHLLAGDPSYYASVLAKDANGSTDDFVNEWKRLVARHGPLLGYEILGSRVSYAMTASGPRVGDQAITGVALHMRDSDAAISYFWLQRGAGQLVDSNPRSRPEPFIGVVTGDGRNQYQACDWLRDTCVAIDADLKGRHTLRGWNPADD